MAETARKEKVQQIKWLGEGGGLGGRNFLWFWRRRVLFSDGRDKRKDKEILESEAPHYLHRHMQTRGREGENETSEGGKAAGTGLLHFFFLFSFSFWLYFRNR